MVTVHFTDVCYKEPNNTRKSPEILSLIISILPKNSTTF
jgi:hypothetical protein